MRRLRKSKSIKISLTAFILINTILYMANVISYNPSPISAEELQVCEITADPQEAYQSPDLMFTLDATVTGGTSPYTYSWDDNGVGGTLSDSTIEDPTWTPSAEFTGTATLTLTVIDTNELSSVCSVDLIVNPAPEETTEEPTEEPTEELQPPECNILVTVDDVNICKGEEAILTANVEGCNNPSYQWYEGESSEIGKIINEAISSTYITSKAGDYTVLVTCDDGCEAEDYGTVIINDAGTCGGEDVNLTITANNPTIKPLGSGTWPDCGWGGTANDVNILNAWLGDINGNELPPCTPGETVEAYIWATFENNTGTNRYAVRIFDEIYVGGSPLESLDECIFDTLPPGTDDYMLYNFSWTCGEEVEIRDLRIAWKTSPSTCESVGEPPDCNDYSKSKCFGPASFIVVAPLVANFEYTNVCYCNDTEFTDTTTGGIEPYSYSWDFDGDGFEDSTEPDPSYHYDESGTYTVTLTVTDNEGTVDDQSYDVTVYPNPECEIDPVDPIICPKTPVQLDATVTGGTPAYTYLWSEVTVVGGTFSNSTIEDPTWTSPDGWTGTATLRLDVTDANGCTNYCTVDVTVLTYTADFTIVKEVDKAAPVVGDTVTYTYTFTNTGDVALSGITVTDSNLGAVTMSPTTLAPLGVATGTLTLDITEENQNICDPIINTADASATDVCGILLEKTSNEITVTPEYTADFTIVKEVDKAAPVVGDTVTYTYTFTNTGDVALSGITVTDSNLGTVTLDLNTLDPAGGANTVATGTLKYTVKEADICGTIENTATASATDPCQETVGPKTDDASVVILCPPPPPPPPQKKCCIKVMKRDEEGHILQGAGFSLYDDEGKKLFRSEQIIGPKGYIVFKDLRCNSTFMLKETTTPEGYQKVNNKLITTHPGSKCDEVRIINKSAEVEVIIPEAGQNLSYNVFLALGGLGLLRVLLEFKRKRQ